MCEGADGLGVFGVSLVHTWQVLLLEYGEDFAAQEQLSRAGFDAVVIKANRQKMNVRTRRVEISRFPVLSGYAFVPTCSPERFSDALATVYVAGFLRQADQVLLPAEVPFGDVSRMVDAAENGEYDELLPVKRTRRGNSGRGKTSKALHPFRNNIGENTPDVAKMVDQMSSKFKVVSLVA